MSASDSSIGTYLTRGEPGTEEYRLRSAMPMMAAIDALPAVWRDLVHEYGYIDVYRAWKRRMSPAVVKRIAESQGGFFRLA